MFNFFKRFSVGRTTIKCIRTACVHNNNKKCSKKKVNFDYGKGIGFVCKEFDFE